MQRSEADWPFHPVIRLPERYSVYDFTGARIPDSEIGPYGVGRYDERRPATYSTELFSGGREIHVGVDLFAPVGTPIQAFADGRIHLFGYNGAEGDYGYTLITEHLLDGLALFALHGHLSAKSVEGKREGQLFERGEVIAWVGDRHENGGWAPHLHFQLSYARPDRPDLPGVVAAADRAVALLKYPDPRHVLGDLY